LSEAIAGSLLEEALKQALGRIAKKLAEGKKLSDYDVMVLLLDQITRRLNDFRSFTESKIDELDRRLNARMDEVERGLIIRINSLDEKLNARVDDVDKKLNARIDEVEKGLNARIDELDRRLNARIDALDEKLNARMDEVERGLIIRINSLDEKLNAKIDGISKRVDDLSQYVIMLHKEVSSIRSDIIAILRERLEREEGVPREQTA